MRLHFYKDRKREWRWRLYARNGKIVATSGEGYVRLHDCRKIAFRLFAALLSLLLVVGLAGCGLGAFHGADPFPHTTVLRAAPLEIHSCIPGSRWWVNDGEAHPADANGDVAMPVVITSNQSFVLHGQADGLPDYTATIQACTADQRTDCFVQDSEERIAVVIGACR